MALRKAKMQEQVAEEIRKADPGETPVVTVFGVTGSHPGLSGAFGMIGQAFVVYYFVTVTDRSVILHRSKKLDNRPQSVECTIDRQEAKGLISEVRLHKVWNSFQLQIPGRPKPTRINVHRVWRGELDRLLAEVGAPTSA